MPTKRLAGPLAGGDRFVFPKIIQFVQHAGDARGQRKHVFLQGVNPVLYASRIGTFRETTVGVVSNLSEDDVGLGRQWDHGFNLQNRQPYHNHV